MPKVEVVPAEYTVTLSAVEWRDLQSVFRKAADVAGAFYGPVGNLYQSEADLAEALFGDEFFDQ